MPVRIIPRQVCHSTTPGKNVVNPVKELDMCFMNQGVGIMLYHIDIYPHQLIYIYTVNTYIVYI